MKIITTQNSTTTKLISGSSQLTALLPFQCKQYPND